MKIKHIIFASFAFLISFIARCELTKSAIAAQHIKSIEEIQENATAADYVQDGLIVLFDGIENVAWGIHDSTTNRWIDLVGGNIALVQSQSIWDENSLVSDGTYRIAYVSPMIEATKNFVSVEMCFKSDKEDMQFAYCDFGRRNIIGCYGTTIGVGLRQSKLLPFSSKDRLLTIAAIYTGSSVGDNTVDIAYYNGNKLTGQGIGNWSTPLSSRTICIGSAYNATTLCFSGHIYALKFYNRTLTHDEVKHNHKIDKIRFGL